MLAAAGVLAAAAIAAWALPSERRGESELGLFTSLPIFWGESGSIAEALEGGEPHWVRTALEADYMLRPLDTLDEAELAPIDRLMIAQPRPLAPAENVALDEWVRAGGRLLVFADPFLTDHSRFALGDRRRPQDIVLLSPILRRWGLDLRFDDEQSEEERLVPFAGERVPVRLAGTFALLAPSGSAQCTLAAEDVVARCRVGKGQVLLVADASVLEGERPGSEGSGPLEALLEDALGE